MGEGDSGVGSSRGRGVYFHSRAIWVEDVRGAIDRGMTREECVASLTRMTDRYPMDVGQDGMAPGVMQMNAANLHDYLTGSGIHQRG